MSTLLHVAARADWEASAARTHYVPVAFAAEGFIHCCSAAQLPGVLSRYFRGREDLLLLELDASALDAPLLHEDTVGSGETFPHVYGALPRAAVTSLRALTVTAAGDAEPMRDAHDHGSRTEAGHGSET